MVSEKWCLSVEENVFLMRTTVVIGTSKIECHEYEIRDSRQFKIIKTNNLRLLS